MDENNEYIQLPEILPQPQVTPVKQQVSLVVISFLIQWRRILNGSDFVNLFLEINQEFKNISSNWENIDCTCDTNYNLAQDS